MKPLSGILTARDTVQAPDGSRVVRCDAAGTPLIGWLSRQVRDGHLLGPGVWHAGDYVLIYPPSTPETASDPPATLVSERARVDLLLTDGSVWGSGYAVGYYDHSTVVAELDDGTQKAWSARLIRRAEPPRADDGTASPGMTVDGDLLRDCIADAVYTELTDKAALALAEQALDNAVRSGMTVLHGPEGVPRVVAAKERPRTRLGTQGALTEAVIAANTAILDDVADAASRYQAAR